MLFCGKKDDVSVQNRGMCERVFCLKPVAQQQLEETGGQDRLEYHDRCAWNVCHLQIRRPETNRMQLVEG